MSEIIGEFEIVPGYFGKQVKGKLANMRKPQTFSVHPVDDGSIMVQSDKSIGQFEFRTGQGKLNTKGSYFPHLSAALGAVAYEFPADFVKAALAVCPPLDSETTIGGVTIVNTIQTI